MTPGMNRISPTIAALRSKLGEARHGGKFFSSEEIEGLLRELRGIQQGATALEDAALARKHVSAVTQLAALPIGTILFQPAGAQ